MHTHTHTWYTHTGDGEAACAQLVAAATHTNTHTHIRGTHIQATGKRRVDSVWQQLDGAFLAVGCLNTERISAPNVHMSDGCMDVIAVPAQVCACVFVCVCLCMCAYVFRHMNVFVRV